MTKTLADKVEKETYMLVSFITPTTTYNFTDSVTKIASSAGIFDLREPTMDIDLPPSNGTFEVEPCTINLPHRSDEFSDLISAQRPFPPTTVKVYEYYYDPIDRVAETYLFFWGRLTKGVKNRPGEEGRVLAIAKGVKAFLKIPAGPVMTHQCPWIFGGKGCTKPFTGLTERVNITSLEAVTIKTQKLSRSYFDNRHFIRGTATVDGLSIAIHSWDALVPQTFILAKQPPASWIGAEVFLEPGCDKTIEQCSFWNWTEHFGGGGYGMPEYNPIIEKE